MQSDYRNPFDSEDHLFLVLVNEKNQYSLWPQFAATPLGWQLEFGPAKRNECLQFVEQNWKVHTT